jgi:dTDP-glucose pyrophosphorylase
MHKIEDIVVPETATIRDVLKIIDDGSKQIALVVDSDGRLLGTVSDGDVRRALLRNISLENGIEGIYNRDPVVADINDTRQMIINLCTSKKVHQVPVVDGSGRVVGLEVLDDMISKSRLGNHVVLMVGGLGTRLRPLTEETPKPMLHVGGKPILQTIVETFGEYGFTEITMCVGYRAEKIMDFFQDGSRFGVNIRYIREEKRLGTAGALSLLPERPKEPFFVMNGDILTKINLGHLAEYHRSMGADATMCVREYAFQLQFGVVNLQNERIVSIEEKPVQKLFVNAGIYMLDPVCLDYIPKNEYFDMPMLFDRLIEEDRKVVSFPLREYWLDIGRIDEYERANIEYRGIFDV